MSRFLSDCVEKMRRRRCKNDGGVTGQSTTSLWKFDAVRQIRVDGAGVYNRATTFVAIADIVYAMTSFWPWSVFLVSLEPWAWGSGGRRPPFIELQEPTVADASLLVCHGCWRQ